MLSNTRRRNFILLAAVFLLGNLILPSQLGFDGPNPLGVYLAVFFWGALTTQLGLVATSCSMNSRKSYDSLIVSALLVLFVWSSFLAGLRIGDPRLPLEFSLILLGIAFGAFAIAQICLRQISLRANWVICHNSDTAFSNQSSQPVSIRFLMLATAAVAIASFLIKLTLPVDEIAGWPPKIKTIVIGAALVLVFSIGLHTLILFVALGERFWWVGLVLLVFALAVVPIAYALLLEWFTRERIWNDIAWTYSYFFGHAFFTLVSLLIVRWMGYRSRSPVC